MTDEPQADRGLGAIDPELEDRLIAERPMPAAGFRGALGRHLAANDPGWGPRPERLDYLVRGYLGVGAVLIVLGLSVATGVL
jgi:hypothetical protein